MALAANCGGATGAEKNVRPLKSGHTLASRLWPRVESEIVSLGGPPLLASVCRCGGEILSLQGHRAPFRSGVAAAELNFLVRCSARNPAPCPFSVPRLAESFGQPRRGRAVRFSSAGVVEIGSVFGQSPGWSVAGALTRRMQWTPRAALFLDVDLRGSVGYH